MKQISYLLLVIILIFPELSVQAQNKGHISRSTNKRSKNPQPSIYTMSQFIGSWQEKERVNTETKEKTAFTDTFYIQFYKNNKADTRQGNSMLITGSSEILPDDYITTSANDFKIISVAPDQIVLDDIMGFLHKMARVEPVVIAEKDKNKPAVVADTVKTVVDLSPASLLKSWYAYRRAASPGFSKPGMPLIRNLKITEMVTTNNYKGEIDFSRSGNSTVQPCTISFTGNLIFIVTEGSSWNMEVYEANGQEVIMGNKGEVVYYFKNNN